MFVSNFSVYLIIILMYLFTFLFIHVLIPSIKTWISLLICCEFTQSVKTRISLSIYLHIYLFVCSFTWIVLYLFTHNLYFFHWMKCRFFQTHPLGDQRWTKICLSVSESSGIRSKKKGLDFPRSQFNIAQSYLFFLFVSFIKGESEKDIYISYLTVELISFVQYCCHSYNRRAMMHAV